MALTVDEIIRLYAAKGSTWYGSEPVSQLEHAMQCALLAEQAEASAELVAAGFLHDIGHLLVHEAHEIGHDGDDAHQYFALPFLRSAFSDEVLEPIRLHVDAKRYLCLAEAGYWESLSPASKHSLELQGGVFNGEAAERFLAQRYAEEAILLRLWDDLAKTPGAAAPGLDYYAEVLRGCAREVAAAQQAAR